MARRTHYRRATRHYRRHRARQVVGRRTARVAAARSATTCVFMSSPSTSKRERVTFRVRSHLAHPRRRDRPADRQTRSRHARPRAINRDPASAATIGSRSTLARGGCPPRQRLHTSLQLHSSGHVESPLLLSACSLPQVRKRPGFTAHATANPSEIAARAVRLTSVRCLAFVRDPPFCKACDLCSCHHSRYPARRHLRLALRHSSAVRACRDRALAALSGCAVTFPTPTSARANRLPDQRRPWTAC